MIYSGGDDTLFKGWDIRNDSSIFCNKHLSSKCIFYIRHEAGVCSIMDHPSQSNILATGSYDEKIRIWDKRSNMSSEILGHALFLLFSKEEAMS